MAERSVITNKLPNRVLLKNIPNPNEATTSSGKWIDGTAAGSATDDRFGFYTIQGVGNMSWQITDEGLTIAATTATGRGRTPSAPFENTTTVANINKYGIRVTPNTSYTFSFKAKGVNVLANSTRGIVQLYNSAGAFVTSTSFSASYIPAGDSDWTDYSVTFTTGVSSCWLVVYPGIFTAGNIMSATFKDFKLDTTVPTTRTTATNRRVARDMGGSTQFNGTTSTIPTTLTDNTAFTSGFVLHGWIKPRSGGESTGGRIIDKSSNTGGATGLCFFTGNKSVAMQVNSGSIIATSIDFITWKHVIAHVASDATVSFYINGVASGTPATTGALSGITTSNALTIGNRSTATDRTFDGNLAELGIISLAGRGDLTADEIAALYTNSTRPTGAAHFWKLNEEPSTYTDSIGGNTGTGASTAFIPDTPVQARVAVRDMGTALKSTAVDHYVSLGTSINDEINTAQAFTVSQWVRRNTMSSLQSFMGVPAGDKFWFNFDSDNAVRMYQQDLTPAFIKTNAKITDTEWHHLVGTFNGTVRQIYIDGIVQSYTATNASTGTLNLNNTFYLVAFPSGNNFIGTVDEPRIWNRALTATEIQNLYLHNIVPEDGLVAEYLFDEATGTTAIDSSGNGNDGTITGATYTTDVPLRPRTSV